MLFWIVNSLFLLFAVLNINDPDWFLWVPTYFMVAASAVAYQKKLINKRVLNILMFYLLFVFGFTFFGFVEIIDQSYDTMVNIKEPNREAIGALMATGWIFWISRRQ
ncbi:MAG: hypothetical protein CMG16_00500 [Candidatus Marinimicrobia bacterium]|mgnify:FL=1|nr:hypothetical protein [Candidatus Neomarinimicrobiota bacterium]|tara:strand:- start:6098 stop:6418 length:321 start_codon:yes stop_codon:yes gene_type:complete